jgi:hypothetical protein
MGPAVCEWYSAKSFAPNKAGSSSIEFGQVLSHSDPGQLIKKFFLGSLHVIIPEFTDHARQDLSVDPEHMISQ